MKLINDSILKSVGISKATKRRKFQTPVLVYKCMNKLAPAYVQEFVLCCVALRCVVSYRIKTRGLLIRHMLGLIG